MLLVGWELVVVANCCCWLLMLVAAVDCCCWLLLLIAAAQKVFEYFRDIVDDLRLRQVAGEKVFEGFRIVDDLRLRQVADEKVFEYFRVVDDLRLRQICRRKSLWIFRVVDEKSLNIFGLLVKSLWIFPEYWWERSGREVRLGEVG